MMNFMSVKSLRVEVKWEIDMGGKEKVLDCCVTKKRFNWSELY